MEYNNFFSKEEVNRIIDGDEVWLNNDDMLRRGIATHIYLNKELVPRDSCIIM